MLVHTTLFIQVGSIINYDNTSHAKTMVLDIGWYKNLNHYLNFYNSNSINLYQTNRI